MPSNSFTSTPPTNLFLLATFFIVVFFGGGGVYRCPFVAWSQLFASSSISIECIWVLGTATGSYRSKTRDTTKGADCARLSGVYVICIAESLVSLAGRPCGGLGGRPEDRGIGPRAGY